MAFDAASVLAIAMLPMRCRASTHGRCLCRHDAGRIYPSYTSNGLELSWRTLFGGNRRPADPTGFARRYRMVFEFGAVEPDKNIVRAPGDLGSTIDLVGLDADFHMTALKLSNATVRGLSSSPAAARKRRSRH